MQALGRRIDGGCGHVVRRKDAAGSLDGCKCPMQVLAFQQMAGFPGACDGLCKGLASATTPFRFGGVFDIGIRGGCQRKQFLRGHVRDCRRVVAHEQGFRGLRKRVAAEEDGWRAPEDIAIDKVIRKIPVRDAAEGLVPGDESADFVCGLDVRQGDDVEMLRLGRGQNA